jgi:hypothetical protein
VVEDREKHGGRVDKGLGKETAVDGQHNRRKECEVAQDQKQGFGQKIRLEKLETK